MRHHSQYSVNEVVNADVAPELFVAIAHHSLGELDAKGPSLQMLLAEAHGHTEAVQIMRTFEKYLEPTAHPIWTLRQDLSYMPGM